MLSYPLTFLNLARFITIVGKVYEETSVSSARTQSCLGSVIHHVFGDTQLNKSASFYVPEYTAMPPSHNAPLLAGVCERVDTISAPMSACRACAPATYLKRADRAAVIGPRCVSLVSLHSEALLLAIGKLPII